jgi:hypothetical protein
MWIWLGPLVGVLVVLCVVMMAASLRAWSRSSEAGGVRVSNGIPSSALEHLEQRKLLQPGEKVLAYYDATVSGDASELAMVTSERLVYYVDRRATALALADIADVRHHTEPLIGDVIDAATDSGDAIHVEIAPLNDGPLFLSTLEAAWKKKRPAPVAKPKAAPAPSP